MDLLFRTSIAAVLAFALLGLAATSAEASHTSGKCRGGKTIAKNSVARLYTNSSGTSMIGCMWSRNERVDLDTAYDDDYVFSEGFLSPKLGGRFVAWTHFTEDISCKADCPPGYGVPVYRLERADLMTGASESVEALPAGSTLRINKRGAVAWLERVGDGRREVHVWDADGHRVLDTGLIPVSSWGLKASTLSWTSDGTPHSVILR